MQLNLGITDRDIGSERQISRISQQSALVSRRFVERINACSNDVTRVKSRPELLEAVRMSRKQLHRAFVDVGHDKIHVDNHHSTGHSVHEFMGQLQLLSGWLLLRGTLARFTVSVPR